MIKLAQDRDANKSLVDMLCIAYAKELKAYHGYLHAYVTVTGPLESVYGDIYESFMEREMHHLEELGKKIIAMGGMPPIEYPSIKPIADAIYEGYDTTLKVLQDAEVETLEMYKKIHAAADKAGDLPLALLIEEIMLEEEEHHDELQRILMDVPGKDNVEVHEELEIDAFEERKYKMAQLFGPPHITDENMDHWIKQWVKLNNAMRDMEDEVGIMDEDGDADPEYKRLARDSKEIKQALDEFDDHWMRDYFGDTELGDEVEPALTMTDYQ